MNKNKSNIMKLVMFFLVLVSFSYLVSAGRLLGFSQLEYGENFSINSSSINLMTHNTSRLYITNDGLVGIGTINPLYKLDVNGTISVSNLIINGSEVSGIKINRTSHSTYAGYLAGNGTSSDYITVFGEKAGYKNQNQGYQTAIGGLSGEENTGYMQTVLGYRSGGFNSGYYSIGIGPFATYLNSGAQVIGIGYEAARENTGTNVVAIGYQAGKYNHGSDLFIVHQANVNSEPLILGNFSSGNLGIGKTNPLFRLDVNGTINASGLNVTGTVESDYFVGDGSLLTGIDTSFENNSDINVTNFVANNTLFVNSGLVGIGTINPTSSLEIEGNISVSKTNNTMGNFSIIQYNSSCSGFRFGATGAMILSCE